MPRKKLDALAALIPIIALGAYLRFSNLDWDNGFQFHPDERGILFEAQTIEIPESREILSRRSTLNPLFTPAGESTYYAYGHFHLYSIVAVEKLIDSLCQALPCTHSNAGQSDSARLARLTLSARLISATVDTLTILIVGLMAHRLFSNLLAACSATAMAASAVIHIQNAHFGTVDSSLAFFATLTIYWLAAYAQTSDQRFSLLAAASMALAVGCKSTGLLLILPFMFSHFAISRTSNRIYVLPRSADSVKLMIRGMSLAVIVFAVSNPFAALYPLEFLSNIATQTQMASGLLDWPFTRQYQDTPRLTYHIVQQARWQLGPTLTIAIYVGLLWALVGARSNRTVAFRLALSWPLIVLILLGTQYVKFPRYLLPALPTLFVLAGGMISNLNTRSPATTALARLIVCVVIVVPSTFFALSFHRMFDFQHPWIAASEWAYRNIPAGSTLAGEYWDDRLPLNMMVDDIAYVREEHYVSVTLDPFAEPDDEAKLSDMAETLSRADYIVLASNRLYGTVARLPDRYPLSSAAYRLLFAEELGFSAIQSFSRYPTFGPWEFVDDPFTRAGLPVPPNTLVGLNLGFADESFTVYDHPLVLIFRNDEHLTSNELIEQILAESEHPQIGR